MKKSVSRVIRLRRRAYSTIRMMFCCASLIAIPRMACAAADVVTYHGDSQRTGWNQLENTLTTTNVKNSFGFITDVALDDYVLAQPLVVTNQAIEGHGVRTVVFVATESNTVYAIDSTSGEILMQRNLGPPAQSPSFDCNNNGHNLGVTGTPTINKTTHSLYVIAYTQASGQPVYHLHSLDMSTLMDKAGSPVIIQASQQLSNGVLSFDARYQRQRPALLEANGNIYAAFGSFCDKKAGYSRGWVLGWNAESLRPLDTHELTNKRPVDYNGEFLSSVWMSGYGIAADSQGHLFFTTGNTAEHTFDSTLNISESVVKMSSTFNLLDSFTPSNDAELDHDDTDFGSGGVLILPKMPGSTVNLAVAAGKDGRLFILNRDSLGGHAAQDVPRNVSIGPCWCGPSFFEGADNIPKVVTSGGNQLQTFEVGLSLTQGSPLASYATGGSEQHVVFIDRWQHVLELYDAAGSQRDWISHDLTISGGAPKPSTGSPLTGYATGGSEQHVIFFAGNRHVYELYNASGSQPNWTAHDLTISANLSAPSTLPVTGSALTGYVTGGSEQHVILIAANRHVYELYNAAGSQSNWTAHDLSVSANLTASNTLPIPGSALTGYVTGGSEQHVIFIANNRHVYELYNASGSQPSWTAHDLTASASAALPGSGSALAGYVTGGSEQHVIFIATNRHVYELYNAAGSQPNWTAHDLTASASAALSTPGSDLSGYATGGSEQHVIFIADNEHVYELYNAAGSQPNWTPHDLTVSANLTASATLPTPGGALTGYVTAGSEQHVIFIAGSQRQVYELYNAAGSQPNWTAHDLFASAPALVLEASASIDASSGEDGGFFTSISSDALKRSTAIIWAVSRPAGNDSHVTVYAFNAVASNNKLDLLWKDTGGTWPNANGNASIVPTIANGRVFVASYKNLRIFGLGGHQLQIAAVRSGQAGKSIPTSGALYWGTLKTMADNHLSVELRTGRVLQVDIAKAAKEQQVTPLHVGQAVAVHGVVNSTGILDADSVWRPKGQPLWGQDRDR